MADVLYLKRGDTAPKFRAQLTDPTLVTPSNLDGAVDLTTATSATLKIKDPAGALIINAALTIENQTTAKGWVNRSWGATDTAAVGVHRCEVEVVWNDGTKQTFPPDTYSSIVVGQDLG